MFLPVLKLFVSLVFRNQLAESSTLQTSHALHFAGHTRDEVLLVMSLLPRHESRVNDVEQFFLERTRFAHTFWLHLDQFEVLREHVFRSIRVRHLGGYVSNTISITIVSTFIFAFTFDTYFSCNTCT